MAGNITGTTGSLYVGEKASPIPAPTDGTPIMAEIIFNGAYQITGALANLELWGESRDGVDTTDGDKISTDTTIKLVNGLDLRAGDVLVLSHPTTGANATTHTIQSYNSETKVITFTSQLARDILDGYGVMLITRNIQVSNLNKASVGFVNGKSNGIACGVRFYNFGAGPITSVNGWNITSCTGYNNTYGGICHVGKSC